MSGVHQKDDTNQQKSEDAGHPGQHPAGVRALWLTKDVDRVGDCLNPGQRGTAVGERAQEHQDRGAHDDAVAVADRDCSELLELLRIVFR